MPDFLAGFRPDLIAIGKGERVVVEVTTREELKDEQSIVALEQVVRSRPGWRFELIIDRTLVNEERQELGVIQIRASLGEGNELQKHGHLAAALLVLWSVTEGGLRLFASRRRRAAR